MLHTIAQPARKYNAPRVNCGEIAGELVTSGKGGNCGKEEEVTIRLIKSGIRESSAICIRQGASMPLAAGIPLQSLLTFTHRTC